MPNQCSNSTCSIHLIPRQEGEVGKPYDRESRDGGSFTLLLTYVAKFHSPGSPDREFAPKQGFRPRNLAFESGSR